MLETNIKKIISGLTESQWQDLYLEHARGERTDIVPFPSEDIQVLTNSNKAERTAKGAISIINCVMECINEFVVPHSSIREKRILDYGCGWGRMTRLLPFYFDINGIAGVDVDELLVNSANELLPYIDHRKITSMEALPFQDASFDIVFANSVFSHLSEKSALFTLAELSRILSTGGILVISTLEQSDMAKLYSNPLQVEWVTKILGEPEQATSKLEKEGFIWGDTGRWHEYGIAIASDKWIANSFKKNGIQYQGTNRGEHRGTQNYNFGVKVAARLGLYQSIIIN
jgi:2-polyprenyl-3-methyl-5-hydroxy-6-metoxy-1,4-benzoquinol methylase